MLKISIITVCYNSAKTIEDTIKSVANQKNVNVEHLLIDGASTDETVKVIRQYTSVTTLVSEPDHGIYDAMNKGIALANGDIIGTLNADDFYMNNHVLEDVAQVFLDPTIDACYGDLLYINQKNVEKTVRFWKSNSYESGLFKSGWMPAHPTFFVRKCVYDQFGSFDLNYKIAADFELLFRLIEQNKIKTQYLPKVLVKMRLGGTTNKNWSNILKQNKEILTILSKYYTDFSVVKFASRKILNRLSQFVMRPKIRFDD
jgi:glycosyltransferase involved in cell wall biosynthesis